ncbi:DUF3889 domain-containing protein [Bacillus sp. EAC]|uniref:DUF3889 domain-containing protein n=1 Tax=Bacillus sp. EAC TaxID=1978338 RepID=UPI000B44F386|nr:DUF3889 domain-containing protein [Bacillus sp. EAC]
MKKSFKFIMMVIVLFFAFTTITIVKSERVYEPPYAKWGKIAVEKTKERYPASDVIDYLHIGRERKTTSISIEKFKLWLRVKDGSREFGVFVNVEFEPSTDRFVGITYQETDR